jgi:murein DD-endopeptidase MepM/ murein hydrolase activator NlpD
LARGIPRLAAHGWALALALFVLALGPLGFRQPIAEVHATSASVTVISRSSVGETAPAPGGDTRVHAQRALPAVPSDDLAAPAAASELSATREHLVRFVWPTHGTITQTFFEYHPGIDIANDVGTPEVAAGGGQVVFAGWGSYGIYVEIDHGNGFHTIYGHMSAVLVKTGQVVTQGQEIGLMGATGRASGPHLHFEIRFQGAPQNPIDLLS